MTDSELLVVLWIVGPIAATVLVSPVLVRLYYAAEGYGRLCRAGYAKSEARAKVDAFLDEAFSGGIFYEGDIFDGMGTRGQAHD